MSVKFILLWLDFCNIQITTNKHFQEGNTIIHLAAEKGHNKVVQVLLEYGADISRINKVGNITTGSLTE